MDFSRPYEEELNEFLSTHRFEDAVIDGANYHYLLCGEGKTVLVFLVGGMGLSYMYMPYVTALESEYRILTFDYPYEFNTNEELADGISALLRYLDIDSAVMIGSSYGGYVAQVFARRYPEQTKGLCLFSTAGLSEQTVSSLREKYQKMAPVLLWVLKHVSYSWLKPMMIRSCMRHAENATEEQLSYMLNMFRFIYRDYTRELDVHMTTLLMDLMYLLPSRPEDFAYLKDRVLLILPENDGSFTPEMQEDLIRMLPDSVIVEGVDSGHISTLLQVDRYVDEIRRFAERLETI